MQLTSENYYSQEANQEYMSVSGYKDFAGTYGKMPCEFYGMEKLKDLCYTWKEHGAKSQISTLFWKAEM